jgi:uncharacterized caspase-like protein
MEKALRDFSAALKGKDTALFYYAGHGVQIQGENFLIPVISLSSTHVVEYATG